MHGIYIIIYVWITGIKQADVVVAVSARRVSESPVWVDEQAARVDPVAAALTSPVSIGGLAANGPEGRAESHRLVRGIQTDPELLRPVGDTHTRPT